MSVLFFYIISYFCDSRGRKLAQVSGRPTTLDLIDSHWFLLVHIGIFYPDDHVPTKIRQITQANLEFI